MGESTNIEWCDHTFNAWIGCEKMSPECKHCYAEQETFARVSKKRGLPLWGPDSHRHVTSAENWKLPLRWNRAAELAGERRRVFCQSLSDTFEEVPSVESLGLNVLDEARRRLWKLVEHTPWLDWLLLTKRPENVLRMVPPHWRVQLPKNVWIGTTAGTQKTYDERIEHLVKVPAAVRFVSAEPLLERVNLKLSGIVPAHWGLGYRPLRDLIHWVIVGGESGRKARVSDLFAHEAIVETCLANNVAVFEKQLGANAVWATPDGPIPYLTKHPKGGDIAEFPERLRVREFPSERAV